MNKKLLILTVCLACAAIFMGPECLAQIQTGVWRTPSNNTDYHHFTRNGGGAAVYINQESTAANYPILRLSSGSVGANTNVRFTVENNGNIGIGTTNPTSKLHVYNATGGAATLLKLQKHEDDINDNSQILFDFVFTDNNTNGVPQARISALANTDISKGTGMEAEGTADLRFWTANAVNYLSSELIERMRITSTGNVGINTTSPSHKLEVNGNIRAQEIKLEAINWPDYVFGENYRQPGLEDLEAFIKANGHLPGLKSAKEYREDGVDMMELNQLMLRQIEEMILFILDQNKSIKELESKVTEQEGVIKEIGELKNEIEAIKILLNKP